jgi:hypothetical protein
MIRAMTLLTFLLAALPVSAAQLRPVTKTDLCISANIDGQKVSGPATVEACSELRVDQEFRKGDRDVLFVNGGCLQVVRYKDKPSFGVFAAPCHGGDGQRWRLTGDGRFVSDTRKCLAISGALAAGSSLEAAECADKPENQAAQKWAVYGRF